MWRSNPTDQQIVGPSATHAFGPPHRDSSPDWQSGENKDLKWRVICAGVKQLCEEQGLNEEDVTLWIDWQSSTPHRSSNPRASRSAPRLLFPPPPPPATTRPPPPPQSIRMTRP